MRVIAIADRETAFPSILTPGGGEMSPCLYICAGWNLLVETGLALGTNLDKQERAQKAGNEYSGP